MTVSHKHTHIVPAATAPRNILRTQLDLCSDILARSGTEWCVLLMQRIQTILRKFLYRLLPGLNWPSNGIVSEK